MVSIFKLNINSDFNTSRIAAVTSVSCILILSPDKSVKVLEALLPTHTSSTITYLPSSV